MLVGSARTSTLEQEAGLEAQNRELQAIGVERLFPEQTSSVGPRPVLDEAMRSVTGTLWWSGSLIGSLGSVTHLGGIVQRLKSKCVALRISNLGVDTNTATGELILNVLGSVAQFERAMMLERQREGVAKAETEGGATRAVCRRRGSRQIALGTFGRRG